MSQALYFVCANYLEVMTAAAQRDACADAGNDDWVTVKFQSLNPSCLIFYSTQTAGDTQIYRLQIETCND